MLRRPTRILCLLVLMVLAGSAFVAQFRMLLAYCPPSLKPVDFIRADEAGLSLSYWDSSHFPAIEFPAVRDWHWQHLFRAPLYRHYTDSRDIFLPWWLLLASWSLVTAIGWHFTRRRHGPPHAFPVEPAAAPTTNPPPVTDQ